MGLSILIAAAEAAPFIKEGGLADVVGALPKFLRQMGHDVRVVLPRYYRIDRSHFNLQQLPGTLVVPMGSLGNSYCAVYAGLLPDSDLPVYFLEHEGYFGRASLYDENNLAFPDNDQRFIFLSRGALELCKMINFQPGIIHCHDWHTAVIPLLLETVCRRDSLVGEAATLLTLHNMQHQGSFPVETMDLLGVERHRLQELGLEKDGRVNLLQGGIRNATLLNTVSQGYAREIRSREYGWGLEGEVAARGNDLHGILNGVDYSEWSPETDSFISAHYSDQDMAGKAICKRDLQRAVGLPERPEVPLIGMVSRLVKQKGIDVLAQALPELLKLDLQLVMLGTGEPWAHFHFNDVAAAHGEKFRCAIGYDNRLSHQIEAGADFFLMPSAFEPCGLNQMYSLRYGTLPIVRATGGLDDSVENFSEELMSGTGFKFWDLTAGALADTVGWAIYTWYNRPEAIQILIRNAMAKRFTWQEAAEKYDWLFRLAAYRRRYR
jgi:starch synthase